MEKQAEKKNPQRKSEMRGHVEREVGKEEKV
jgi:hypothetical protein